MSTNLNPLDPLASAIADLVWVKIQEKFVARDVKLISVLEASKRVGVSDTKMRRMISDGEFPEKCTRRIGRRVMVIVPELDRWLSAR